MRKLGVLVLFALAWSFEAHAQFHYLPLEQNLQDQEAYTRMLQDTFAFTSVRPLRRDEWGRAGARAFDRTTSRVSGSAGFIGANWWEKSVDYALHHNLVDISQPDFALTVNPLLNMAAGTEFQREAVVQNSRGVWVEGRIGEKFTFQTALWEQLAFFPSYLENRQADPAIPGPPVVPGQGIQRPLTSGIFQGAVDYGMAQGSMSYRPNRFFHFSLGHGKNFFGEGYRSLFLSDNAFPSPFFKIETQFWRVKYVNLWTRLTDIGFTTPSGKYGEKYGAFHYLDIALTKRWNLQFFEGVIMGDTLQNAGLDVNFLNPIILYRSVEFSTGSNFGNAVMGAGTTYRFGKNAMAYAQFVLDEFNFAAIKANSGSWLNKFGYQVGAKVYEPFGLKNFFGRAEFNAVRPYTFSHRLPLTNYGHYAQPLAHPWGANFYELVLQTRYTYGRFAADLQLNLGKVGRDSTGENYGSNIYLSYNTRQQDEGNAPGQGRSGQLAIAKLELSYLVNPAANFQIYTLLQHRSWSGASTYDVPQSTYFLMGIRTQLWNQYFDL